MKGLTKDLKQLIKILEEQCGNIEIVSYGLSPNPNGFCYEVYNPDKIDKSKAINFCYLINNLTNKEEKIIKELYL
jgi:hypothetical protein